MCLICLTKESKKVFQDRRKSKMGIHVKIRSHREEAEFLIDSSGISDSSCSSDEDDFADDDFDTS